MFFSSEVEAFKYEDMLHINTNDLPLNDSKIISYAPQNEDIDFIPTKYSIERVGNNLVQITPHDELYNDIFLLEGIEEIQFLHNVNLTNLLTSIVSIVKSHSELEPVFELETKKEYFCYRIFISGNTIEDIFNKLRGIYHERADKNSADFSELKNQILNK